MDIWHSALDSGVYGGVSRGCAHTFGPVRLSKALSEAGPYASTGEGVIGPVQGAQGLSGVCLGVGVGHRVAIAPVFTHRG